MPTAYEMLKQKAAAGASATPKESAAIVKEKAVAPPVSPVVAALKEKAGAATSAKISSAVDATLKSTPVPEGNIVFDASKSAFEKEAARLSAIPSELKQYDPSKTVREPGTLSDTFKKAARILLPKKLEDLFGLSEKSDIQKRIETWGDISLSNDRMSELDSTVREVAREKYPDGKVPAKKDYKEPTGFWGQAVEGFTQAYVGTMKPVIGTMLETMGGSPEAVAKGRKMADRAAAELILRPELQAPADLPEFFKGGIGDRRWWGRAIGGAVPSIAAALAASTGTALVTKNPIAAATAAWTTTYGLEKTNSYRDMIEKGVAPDKANSASTIYGAIAAQLEMGMGVNPGKLGAKIALGSPAVEGVFSKSLVDSFLKYTNSTLVKAPVKLLYNALQEGNEEAMQQFTQNLVTGFLYAPQGLTEHVAESWAQGFAGGLPFGGSDVVTDFRKGGKASEKNTSAESTLVSEVADALKRNHSPTAVETELKKNLGIPASQAERIVKTAAKEAGIKIPEFLEEEGGDTLMAGIEAAAASVKEGSAENALNEGEKGAQEVLADSDIQDVVGTTKLTKENVDSLRTFKSDVSLENLKKVAETFDDFGDFRTTAINASNSSSAFSKKIKEWGYTTLKDIFNEVKKIEVPKEVNEILEQLSETEKVQEDWQENFSEKYEKLSIKLAGLEKQIKTAKTKEMKANLESQRDAVGDIMVSIENDFVSKYQKEGEKIKEKNKIREAVEDVEKTLNPVWTNKAYLQGQNPDKTSFKEGDVVNFDGKNRTITSILKKDKDTKYELTPIDNEAKKEDIDSDGKGTNNTRRSLPKGPDTKGDKTGGEEPSARGNDDTESSSGVARRKRGKRSASAGERPATPVEPNLEALEKEAEEKRESLDTSNEDIAIIVSKKTKIGEDKAVTITGKVRDSDLEKVNAYTGAGGVSGAEGRGILDEYYTPPDVSTMTGAVLSHLGVFRDGMKVLEPSAGIGAMLGDVPLEALVDAFEINPTAAGVLKMNFPESNVKNLPFEDLFMSDRGVKRSPEASYDLVIGNPPYGSHRGKYRGLGEEAKIDRYEEYFLKRALDLTKEGGYIAMVIPSGFIRGPQSYAKELISKQGDLVTSYRLPNGAFPTTDVGTDLVVFKKSSTNEGAIVAERIRKITNDEYFTEDHPENVLGENTTRRGRFGEEPAVAGDIEAATDTFYKLLDKQYAESQSTNDEAQDGIVEELNEAYKPEVYKEARKRLPKKEEEAPVSSDISSELFGKELAKYKTVKAFAESLKKSEWGDYRAIEMEVPVDLIEGAEPTDASEMVTEGRQVTDPIEVVYDVKEKTWTVFDGNHRLAQARSNGQKTILSRVGINEDATDENGDFDGQIDHLSEGDISNFYKKYAPKLEKNEKVVVRSGKTDKVLKLSNYSTSEGSEAELWKFVQPTGELKGNFPKENAFFYKGEWYNRFNYLQGDIYEKLDQLKKDEKEIGKEESEEQRKALTDVLPAPVTIERMSITPSSRFAHDLKVTLHIDAHAAVEEQDLEASLSDHFIEWMANLPTSAFGESSQYSIRGYVNNQAVRGGDKVQNESERRTRRIEGDRLFKLFIRENLPDAVKAQLVEQYNRLFNSYYRPDYRSVPLVGNLNSTFKGNKLEIREVQLQGIGFLVNRGVGLLAHDVGLGKTMQSIIAVQEVLERGWAKRPLIVAPNPNVYQQWIKEIKELLPDVQLNLLANLGGDFKGDLKTLQIPEKSISIITEEGFKRLGFSNETYDSLTSDFLDVIENPNTTTGKRERVLEQTSAEEAVAKGIRGTREERFFEDLGFDHITVDEAHNANHIISRAKMESGKTSEFRGFNVKPSQFGLKVWLAAQYIQKKNSGRNVQLATATPFTNNPLEYYSILSLMARERMKRMGILNVNDFMTMFMEISTEHEFKADGSYIEKSEVRSFKNYQQFQKLLTEFIDFRDGVEAGVRRPERLSREYVVGETEDAAAYKTAAQELFKDTLHAGALKAIGELRAIAFSPFLSRYYTGEVPSVKNFIGKSPKLKTLVEIIKQTLKDNPDGGHLIYSPVGVEYFPILREALASETGLKLSEVEIISGATPKPKRSSIQEDFNTGKVKIVIGSDAIQEGVNLQENTTDLHILSLPWNFTQVRQVIGRAWRQGNKWPRIRVNTYFTENSVDVFLSQKLQNKEKRYEEALKFKGDKLDVGDINFEEMKFDLITDAVHRTDLEYQFKEKELEHEIKRKLADQGYKNRRVAELIEAQKKVRKLKEYLADIEQSGRPSLRDYYESDLARAEKKLEEVKERLKDRGIDVADIERELTEADNEVSALRTKIEDLQKEKAVAIEKAKSERVADLTQKETDFDEFVKARAEENEWFYVGKPEKKMLRTTGAVLDSEWNSVMDEELTEEEQEALVLGRELVAKNLPVPKAISSALNSGYKKYLDFMDKTEKLSLQATREGVPFDLTEEAGEKVMRSLFDEKEIGFLFKKSEPGPGEWGTYTPERSWRNPLISVVTNNGMVQSSTIYHEAFHAFVDNFVSEEERKEVFERVNKHLLTLPARLSLRVAGYKAEEVAEEWLADDFARYKAGMEHLEGNKSFYSKIVDRVRGWIRKLTGAQRIYDAILSRKNRKPLIVSEVLDEATETDEQDDATVRAKLRGIGMFGFFQKDLAEQRKEGMEAIKNIDLGENRNLIRKDINALENMVFQARDLYLKDPNEFAAAGTYQKAADTRRIKKASLDQYFSDTLTAYYKGISQSEQERVNAVLMEGDIEAKEFSDDELRRENLNAAQIAAYKAVRKAFNVAHQYLITEMRKNGVPEEEVQEFERERAGYMPHKWKHRFVVKHQVRKRATGEWKTFQMDNFKTKAKAEEEFNALMKKNVREDVRYTLDTLDNLEVDFFTEQKLSFEAMKSMITQARTTNDIKETMIEAVRNMVKEKGFGRNYMKRTGVRGYEQKEVPKLMADYFSGMNGFLTKMEAGKKYYELLSTIDARRQKNFYSWMRDMIAYDMGNTKEWHLARAAAFTYYLANDISFLLTNATQNLVVGTGELSKYMTGTDKIIGPEKAILKAMFDWSTGRVTADEKKVVEDLVKFGELGGEMTSELMGFKNNPLYSEISSTFSKVMYKSTSIVEQNVNRIPAFLAARRLFLEQGMSEKEANTKALEVSNDIHFRYGKQNRPRFERGRKGILFVFYHYMRSLMLQLYRDATRKEFASLTRKLLYTAILGGTSSLPFASSLLSIYRGIFGAGCGEGDEESCELNQEMSDWEVAVEKGLPALTGVDLSGRVGIDLMSVSSIMENPNDVRSYLGAVGNLFWLNLGNPDQGGRIQQGIELLNQGRIADALGKLTPDMTANLFKAYTGYKWGVRSFAGTPLEDANGDIFKYNSWEALIRATGFTPTRENLAWDAKSKQFMAEDDVQQARSGVRRTIQGMVQRGEIAEARVYQSKAIEDGTLGENTNYIKEFGKETFIKEALDKWNLTEHTSVNLHRIEDEVIDTLYDGKETPIQRLNVRKEFAIYRAFGLKDELVDDIQEAENNKDRVELLIAAKKTLGEEKFLEFLKKARKTIRTEAGNESHILISDELIELYKKENKKDEKPS